MGFPREPLDRSTHDGCLGRSLWRGSRSCHLWTWKWGLLLFRATPQLWNRGGGQGVSTSQSLLSWLQFWHFSWINTFPGCYQPLVHFQSFEKFNLDLFGSGFAVFVEGEFSVVLTKTAISSCHSLLMRILISLESQVHTAWITEHRPRGNPLLSQDSHPQASLRDVLFPAPRVQHEDRSPRLGEQTDAESFPCEDSSDCLSCWSSAPVPPRPCTQAASGE